MPIFQRTRTWIGLGCGLMLLAGVILYLCITQVRPHEALTISFAGYTNVILNAGSSGLITNRPPLTQVVASMEEFALEDQNPAQSFERVLSGLAAPTTSAPPAGATVGNGLITDAADATARAIQAANEAAQRRFARKPFDSSCSPAVFDGQHWTWHALAGAGSGDLAVTVQLNPDGSIKELSFTLISSSVSL